MSISREERQRLREEAEAVVDLCAGNGVSLPARTLLALLDELDKSEEREERLRFGLTESQRPRE